MGAVAVIGGIYNNLLNLHPLLKNGKFETPARNMFRRNTLIEDAVVQQANEMMGHTGSYNTSMPAGSVIKLGGWRTTTTASWGTFKEGISMFTDGISTPKDIADKTSPRRISIKARDLDGQALQLDVGDNGAGMSATVLGRIFDPFFTSKLGQGGSGLGLHIVHNIVTDVLAGSITVESEVGHGTTFSIVIPRVTPTAAIVPDQRARA